MSYVLINGKRYYKDDRTGRIVLDNVSQAEADRRALRGQGAVGYFGINHQQAAPGNGITTEPIPTSRTSGTAVLAGFPWKAAAVCVLIALLIGAFFYDHYHVSSEEQAIINYMNSQQSQEIDTNATEIDASTSEADAYYIMPDSAERYLEAAEIEGFNHHEIQMIINEIYARHGRVFEQQDNIDYFSAQDWYEPIPGKSDEDIISEFNEFEKKNVDLLSDYL